MKSMTLATLLFSLACPSALAAELIIDDFTTGYTSQKGTKCGISDQTVLASVPGEHRWIRSKVNDAPDCKEGNPFAQSVSANIQPGLPLIVNNGYKVRSRTEIHYGRNNKGQQFPMNMDLTLGTGIPFYLEIMFASAATDLNLDLGVLTKNGKKRAGCITNVPSNANGFSVAFPLVKFKMENGMQPIDYQSADFLSIAIQTADGNFGVTRIKATSKPTSSALKADCL